MMQRRVQIEDLGAQQLMAPAREWDFLRNAASLERWPSRVQGGGGEAGVEDEEGEEEEEGGGGGVEIRVVGGGLPGT